MKIIVSEKKKLALQNQEIIIALAASYLWELVLSSVHLFNKKHPLKMCLDGCKVILQQ